MNAFLGNADLTVQEFLVFEWQLENDTISVKVCKKVEMVYIKESVISQLTTL